MTETRVWSRPDICRRALIQLVLGRTLATLGGCLRAPSFSPPMLSVSSQETRAYYATALAALHFVEARRATGRRFGADADARWSGLRGDLATADRLDLLLRDADAEWPGAFGARLVFRGHAIAEDDAFGPFWSSLEPVTAEEFWTAAAGTTKPSVDHLIEAWAKAWDVKLGPFSFGDVAAADRFIVAGASAVAAAIRLFAARPDFSWDNQVAFFASSPAERQLAAIGSAVMNSTRAPMLLASSDAPPFSGRAVVSDDAGLEDAAAARRGVA